MSRWRYPGMLRDGVTIAVATAATAYLAGLAAVASVHLSLPPHDSASSQSTFATLLDPFVQTVLIFFVAIGALAAFPCVWMILIGTDLRKTVPPGVIATVLAAFVSGFIGSVEAVLVTLVAGVLSLMLIRAVYELRRARGARTPRTS